MQSDTPERVAGIPAGVSQGFAGSWPGQHGGNLFSHRFESAEVIHLERLVAHADFACVSPFGFDDVAADLVTVATAAARSLAQFFWRTRDGLFQHLPRSAQKRRIALRGRRVDWPAFYRSLNCGYAPGSVRVARQAFNYREIARRKVQPGPL